MRGLRELGRSGALLPCVALVILCIVGSPAIAAVDEEGRYQVTTITGKLTDPETAKPMVGAAIRFQPVEQENAVVEATTDANGTFVARGLSFGNYVVEIQTADGEKILGVTAFPIEPGKPIMVDLKISERVVSTTSMENRPARFAIAVDVKPINWKRFWTEFGIFFGAAATAGAVAL